MYRINYVDGLIVKEKYGNLFVKILKILNFFAHVAIAALLVLSFLTYMKTEELYGKINVTKKMIEQKRNDNRISEIKP